MTDLEMTTNDGTRVVRAYTRPAGTMLAIDAPETADGVATRLTPAQAHEIAQWILANVEKPEPQTLIDWEKIPVGGQFGFGKYEPEGPGPYVKDGEWSFRIRVSGYPIEDIRDSSQSDLEMGLTYHRPALPTKFAAVVKTTDGKLYTRAVANPQGNYVWVGYGTDGDGGDWETDSYLIAAGFEVIFEGVDL